MFLPFLSFPFLSFRRGLEAAEYPVLGWVGF